jgi:flagellar hook assembly protein FlgD
MQTLICFNIPVSLSNSFTELLIYNINGEIVKKLISKELPAGNYLTKWDGTNNSNNVVASGIYFYNLKVSGRQITGKMNLLK